jgi:hypothetical protein
LLPRHFADEALSRYDDKAPFVFELAQFNASVARFRPNRELAAGRPSIASSLWSLPVYAPSMNWMVETRERLVHRGVALPSDAHHFPSRELSLCFRFFNHIALDLTKKTRLTFRGTCASDPKSACPSCPVLLEAVKPRTHSIPTQTLGPEMDIRYGTDGCPEASGDVKIQGRTGCSTSSGRIGVIVDVRRTLPEPTYQVFMDGRPLPF